VINLDPREFEKFITNYTEFYTNYLHFAKEQGCPILDVDFVDLQNPEKVREIQKFAQFDDFSNWDQLTLVPTTVKQDKSSKVQEDFLAEIGKDISDYNFKAVRV
jgi:hypothetical protein